MEEYHDLWTLSPHQSELLKFTLAVLEDDNEDDIVDDIVNLLANGVDLGSSSRTCEFPKELIGEAMAACSHEDMGTRVDSLFHVVMLAYGYGWHAI